MNSGIEGIAAIYQTENDNKVVTTVEISAGIKAKTFARVLEFLYIGNGIYLAHFIFFQTVCSIRRVWRYQRGNQNP